MCAVLAIAALCFYSTSIHRSRYGDRVLQNLRTDKRSVVVSQTYRQLLLMLALLGVSVVPVEVVLFLFIMIVPLTFVALFLATIAFLLLVMVALPFSLYGGNRSRQGDRVLQDLHTNGRSTVVDDTDAQLPLMVALMGVKALPNDTLFADLRRVLTPVSSDGGGGGDSGGSSCGGGGGDSGGGGGGGGEGGGG